MRGWKQYPPGGRSSSEYAGARFNPGWNYRWTTVNCPDGVWTIEGGRVWRHPLPHYPRPPDPVPNLTPLCGCRAGFLRIPAMGTLVRGPGKPAVVGYVVIPVQGIELLHQGTEPRHARMRGGKLLFEIKTQSVKLLFPGPQQFFPTHGIILHGRIVFHNGSSLPPAACPDPSRTWDTPGYATGDKSEDIPTPGPTRSPRRIGANASAWRPSTSTST